MKVIDQLPWNHPFNTQDDEGKEVTTTLKTILTTPHIYGMNNATAAVNMTTLLLVEQMEKLIAQRELERPSLKL